MPFHAGLSPMEKRVALTRFRSGEAVVMVATIAFGMGIDRPDVRFVVHLDMPDSPEAYYQQIGRAGRDGDRADTLLLYGGEDIVRARHWLEQSTAPEARSAASAPAAGGDDRPDRDAACRTRTLLACFGETLAQPCGHCDSCADPVALFDGTVAAQKVLSAIYRTGQMFGALHITAVLRGERTRWWRSTRTTSCRPAAPARDQPEGFWRGVIRQLVATGALRRGEGERAGLALVTEQARPILRGETVVMLREEAPAAAAHPRSAPARRPRGARTTCPPGRSRRCGSGAGGGEAPVGAALRHLPRRGAA